MRKINNEFWNLVRFVSPDNKHSKSYHEETQEVQHLRAEPGEYWRFLMPKSDLQGLFLGRAKLVLIRPEWISYNEQSQKNEIAFPRNGEARGIISYYITEVGKIRRQECEKYCEFKLIVNSFPKGNVIKQFILQRSTGEGVFGTFSSLQSNKFEFMQELKRHFEKNGDMSCLCDIEGNTITVRAYVNDRFFLNDQSCSITIGSVIEENVNNPQLDARYLSTVTIPAQDSYEVLIKNISIGNVLTLGSKSITVKLGDTEISIREYLLGTQSNYLINQGERVNYGFSKGSYLEVNQSKPTVLAVYQSTASGLDTYKIQIIGNIIEGNTIQLSAQGKTPINRTITVTDTVASITKLFSPDAGGTYKVLQGNMPIVSVFEGSRTVLNTNSLEFLLKNKTSIPAKVVDRYKCYISDDIKLRNEFRLFNKTYIAKEGDTPLIVAQALGQNSRQFIIEINQGSTLTAFAQKGKLYGDENIMDIKILKQPKVRQSNQYVCEVQFPKTFPEPIKDVELNKGEWQLAIYDTIDSSLLALGNFIEFGSRLAETKLVEFAGVGVCYGYEYLERGVSQIMRVPIMLKHKKHETEENMTNLISGGFARKETNVMQYQDFVTKAITQGAIQALQVLLRHENVIIEGKQYQSKGEMSDNFYDEYEGNGQLAGRLYLQGKKSNNGSFLGLGVTLGYGTVTVEGNFTGRRVLFETRTENFIIQESSTLKAGEYDVLIDNPQQEIGCIVYENDVETNRVVISAKARNRIRPLVRLNADGNVRLVFMAMSDLVKITTFINEDEVQTFTVINYGNESKNQNPPNLTGGGFTEGFDLGFES